ncbi:glutathione S-transferase T3-like [Brassica napus]|uniref:glutathione S-transferase T3-like n=1 Tax=Brassica napus TaxID=3708 RepID=UPI00207A121F|nr:glutathione S-transferase T3-like [Brassica napus]
MGLLNNVHNNNVQENFAYESYPSTVDIGASEIPPFSSQQSEAPSQPQDTPVERMDAVVGNSMKLQTFWKRVDEYFAATLHEKIENVHCKQRWHRINDQTNKFCAVFAAAERVITSGQSDNDVLKLAHEIFYSDQGQKFTLEHAWCVMRHEQKWISLNTPTPTGSKRKSGEVSSQTSSAAVGEVSSDYSMRPEGIKAAKASRNIRKGKAIEDYKTIMEGKMEELARKEKLSKLAILDTLLAKKDPLSLSEETVKNKLLVDLF